MRGCENEAWMVNRDKIEGLLQSLEQSLNDLREITFAMAIGVN